MQDDTLPGSEPLGMREGFQGYPLYLRHQRWVGMKTRIGLFVTSSIAVHP